MVAAGEGAMSVPDGEWKTVADVGTGVSYKDGFSVVYSVGTTCGPSSFLSPVLVFGLVA